MPRVMQLEVMTVDLPFRHTFRHAAAARRSSESLFVKCVTDFGTVGFGESLPRDYVTGETRDGAFALLQSRILPRLLERQFDSMPEVYQFLERCDGKAPAEWLDADLPQLAAWCAVDLALLDAFGRAFGETVHVGHRRHEIPGRYSGVVSADTGWKFQLALWKLRLYGIKQVKLKVGQGDPLRSARAARRALGRKTALRLDANMAWTVPQALNHIRALRSVGIHCVEQPLPPEALADAAMLVRETEAEIIADEALTDRSSLERLTESRACRGVNVRISKCGGLVAAGRRCAEARHAGFLVQVGCQVGESSLLSAAQRILISGIEPPDYLEGCYGQHLLQEDPVFPRLQLGYGGRPPRLPVGPGLTVTVDEGELNRWVRRRASADRAPQQTEERRTLCR